MVFDTATNTITATVPVVGSGVAVTPDGAHVYVKDTGGTTVYVIATATNTVTASVPVGYSYGDVAVSPDGTHVYVPDFRFGRAAVEVIETATNTVTASVPVPNGGAGVDVTPDGAHVYVPDGGSNAVSVMDVATNTVTASVAVGTAPYSFGKFITPVVSIQFAAFSAKVDISLASSAFNVNSTFTLGTGGSFNLATDPMTVQLQSASGSASITIPAGSFRQNKRGSFLFSGVINGFAVDANLDPLGGNSYSLNVDGAGVPNLPTTNPVTLLLTIGKNTGSITVNASIQ